MRDAGLILLMLLLIFMFVLTFICVRKEKELSGFYKAINVCGRWYAFFTVDIMFAGVMSIIMIPVSIVLMIMGKLDNIGTSIATLVLGAVIYLPLGLFMYRRAFKKCPDNLKKGFLKDIIIIMLGTTFRICFFFLAFILKMWWEYNKPTGYLINGKIAYTYGNSNDLYDENGKLVGRRDGVDTAIMTDSRYHT